MHFEIHFSLYRNCGIEHTRKVCHFLQFAIKTFAFGVCILKEIGVIASEQTNSHAVTKLYDNFGVFG